MRDALREERRGPGDGPFGDAFAEFEHRRPPGMEQLEEQVLTVYT
jgi:hypothetical protein